MTTYDPKCEELARHFLPSVVAEHCVVLLAIDIQQAIEDWLAEWSTRPVQQKEADHA